MYRLTGGIIGHLHFNGRFKCASVFLEALWLFA